MRVKVKSNPESILAELKGFQAQTRQRITRPDGGADVARVD